ncbi:hypothetical protein Q7P35_003791 [Cladosporium inversicolor]
MSNERRLPLPLLPKPSVPRFEPRMYNIDPQLRESSVTSESPLKRFQVQAAFTACHKRKTKCDGNRPSCARCEKNGVSCRYDVEPDGSRFASIQRKNESLQYELGLLHKLVVHIRTSSSTEAEGTVRQIRAGSDPLEIARSLSTV